MIDISRLFFVEKKAMRMDQHYRTPPKNEAIGRISAKYKTVLYMYQHFSVFFLWILNIENRYFTIFPPT